MLGSIFVFVGLFVAIVVVAILIPPLIVESSIITTSSYAKISHVWEPDSADHILHQKIYTNRSGSVAWINNTGICIHSNDGVTRLPISSRASAMALDDTGTLVATVSDDVGITVNSDVIPESIGSASLAFDEQSNLWFTLGYSLRIFTPSSKAQTILSVPGADTLQHVECQKQYVVCSDASHTYIVLDRKVIQTLPLGGIIQSLESGAKRLYICDNRTIHVYTRDMAGLFVQTKEFSTPTAPLGLASRDGTLIASLEKSNLVYNSDGALQQSIPHTGSACFRNTDLIVAESSAGDFGRLNVFQIDH